jgi:hypothetical protein
MKLLSDASMIALVEGASDLAIREAQAAIPKAVSSLADDWLEYGVKEGFYQTATLRLDGQDVATLFYSLDGPTLRINACHARVKRDDLEDAYEIAFRRLAGDLGALRVQFETKRGGAIKKALRRGYEICGVILRREITGAAPIVSVHHDQAEQQQQSGPSESKQQTSTAETATNEQVAATGGGVGIGAGSSGNTVNVTSSDVNALNESQAVSTAALASNTDVTRSALAANIAGLQAASAVAQTGLAAGTTLGGEAIASNEDIAGGAIAGETNTAEESIAGGEEESLATLSAAQNLGALGIASGVQTAQLVASTSTDDLNAALGGAEALTAGSQATETNVVQSSLAAVLAGQANSNTLIQSVVNSNTQALENSDTLAYETAAGAVSQEGQIAGSAAGDQSVGAFSASPLEAVTGGAHPVAILVVAALGIAVLFLAVREL